VNCRRNMHNKIFEKIRKENINLNVETSNRGLYCLSPHNCFWDLTGYKFRILLKERHLFLLSNFEIGQRYQQFWGLAQTKTRNKSIICAGLAKEMRFPVDKDNVLITPVAQSPSIQSVPRAFSLGLMQSGCVDNHFFLLSVATKIINQLPLFATYRVFIVHNIIPHYMFRLYGHPQVYHIYKNAKISSSSSSSSIYIYIDLDSYPNSNIYTI
jgi:hypothetical protein